MGRLIAKMSIPLMISMMIQALYNIVDGYFVAKLGKDAISAIGISFPIQMLMIATANGLGVGMNALISQRFGRGEGRAAGKAAGNSLLLSLCGVLVFMAIGLFGSQAFFQFSSEQVEIQVFGVTYLRTICLGCLGLFVAIYAERLLQVTGRTTLSMCTQLVGAVLNLILDPILIFGLFGAPEMGMLGAAVATVIGQWASALVGVLLNWRVNRQLKLSLGDIRLDGDALTICRVGLPVALTMAMGSVSTFGVNAILRNSLIALPVFTVFYRLQSFFFMPMQGMMQGLIPIVGFNYGAKRGERVRAAIVIAVKVELGIMLAGLLICQLFPGPIFGLFADQESAGMLTMGIACLRVVSWTFPVAGSAVVLSNIYQGMGNGMPSMVCGVLRQCVFLLPAVGLLLFFGGVDAIWFAFWIAEALTLAVVVVQYRKEYASRVKPLLDQEKPPVEAEKDP